MHNICLVFWKSEPRYAHKHYAYKKHVVSLKQIDIMIINLYPQFKTRIKS